MLRLGLSAPEGTNGRRRGDRGKEFIPWMKGLTGQEGGSPGLASRGVGDPKARASGPSQLQAPQPSLRGPSTSSLPPTTVWEFKFEEPALQPAPYWRAQELRHRVTRENWRWLLPRGQCCFHKRRVTPSCQEYRERRSSLPQNSFRFQRARAPSTFRRSSHYALRQEGLRQTSLAFSRATAVY